MPKPMFTEEQIEYIKSMYYKTTNVKLAEEFGCSKSTISAIWMKSGLKGKSPRKYFLNEDYFKTIDSKDKAYLLGVIAADGCVYKKDNRISSLCFQFHIQEKEIIDILLKYLESDYVPRITENRISVQINSNKLCDDLSKYNIIPRKTWTYYPLGIPEEFESHFIRGFFDGDGSFCCNKNGRLCDHVVNFCGNLRTMNWIKDVLLKNGIVSIVNKDNRHYSEDFYVVRIKNNYEKYKFINYLYEKSDGLRLSRKYNKCLSYLDKYTNKYGGIIC